MSEAKALSKLPSGSVYRHSLGIVGCGPRGLHCLERLANELAAIGSGEGYDIVLFEPSPWAGAGCVYDLRQPEYLRVNYAIKNIDVWSLREQPRPPSLVQWLLKVKKESVDAEEYLPRSVVGDYLQECLQIVQSELIALGCSIQLCSEQVDSIEVDAERLAVHAGERWYRFDDLVLTTGHEGWRGATRDGERRAASPAVVSHVFPVERMLSTSNIPCGSKVAVRGFSLCFIDAALALTQGRGGEFIRTPTGLRYRRSNFEPDAIYPYCRSGRPMRCKPQPQKMCLPASIRTVWEEGRTWLEGQKEQGGASFESLILPIVFDCAQRSLRLCGVEGSVEAWYGSWLEASADPWDVFDEMRKSCAIASGKAPVDAGWALGESWRQLYPAVASLAQRGGLETGQWKRFWRFHQEMERIAFGPPLENMEKLVALVGAGRVKLDALKSPEYEYEEDSAQFVSSKYEKRVDVLVDAVLPGFQDFSEGSLLGSLMAAKRARRDPVSGGVQVAEDGALIDARGQPDSRLVYFGRATEGWLLGNDSLGRNPREGISLWAEKMAAKVLESTKRMAR
ncbi:FAD/NAD(P)-binding protein [Pelagicoccus sp. SDUM812005]|uniref:FAD/NAD(P)-binding protein n=1 Tax=Pelagicoccus sp. SDUM812005 TaxID=3041257 RepID=UPI00280D45EF|nr:FAD/NAD(P)-binding protein [Pelagicoccus sp. SDUM812005]MDQ8181044.1 FAD/NAD(P)-binding protein [Pelagicoccus sp. SDUM812005]